MNKNVIFKNYTKLIPILTWMLIIFLFSNQPAQDSNTMSLGITKTIYNLLLVINIDDFLTYDMMNHIIRKLAHFTIYLILGVLVIRSFKKPISSRNLLRTVFICFIYAYTDEFHQSFIPGRAMMFSDVIIDTFGSVVGVILFQFYYKKIKVKSKDD